jgi:hypothetical protein
VPSGGARCWRPAPSGTIEELAAAEKINAFYLGRILRLTLLALKIVEAILDGRQPTTNDDGKPDEALSGQLDRAELSCL